jgi:hypothetical protein
MLVVMHLFKLMKCAAHSSPATHLDHLVMHRLGFQVLQGYQMHQISIVFALWLHLLAPSITAHKLYIHMYHRLHLL